MTKTERDELRRVCAAATPGPWNARNIHHNGTPYPTLYEAWAFVEPSVCGLWASRGTNLSDAHFIAAAREAVPRLLDALDQADAEIARLRSLLATDYTSVTLRTVGTATVRLNDA